MTERTDSKTMRTWIDDELVESVEPIPEDVAEFNFGVEMSNIPVHVLRREPDGPVLVDREIEDDAEIRSRIRQLAAGDRNDLVAGMRETFLIGVCA